MFPIVFLVVAVASGATIPRSSVHRLPIRRTTIEMDWRFSSAYEDQPVDVPENPLLFAQHPHPFRKVKIQNENQFTMSFGDNKFGGEDEIEFWSIYTAPVRLGNPPMYLDAIIDTSWSTFFAASANCTYDDRELYNCIIHPLYNSSLSTTYRPDLSPCRMVYWGVQGIETYGKVSYDSLHIAELEIKDQIFDEATKWHPGYFVSDDFFDTVLGLALYQTWSDESNFSAPGPFQSMIKEELLRENMFSLTLPKTDNELGEIVFGGLPENVTREDLTEVPLSDAPTRDDDKVWKFYASNGWHIWIESMAMTLPSSNTTLPVLGQQQIAIVTSSWPFIGLPDEAVTKANENIGLKSGATWIDCDARSSLPDLVLDFGAGKQIKLAATDYLVEAYDYLGDRIQCVSAFFSLGEFGDSGMILLGSPFLNGLHSVFDADRKSISFGNRPS